MIEDSLVKKLSPLFMIMCAAMWSTGGILIKLVDWHPIVISGLRALVAAPVIGLYMIITKTKLVFNKRSTVIGCFLFLAFIPFVVANKLTSSANVAAIQFTSPIFVMIISAIFFRQKFTKFDVACVLITIFGIALFFLDKLSLGNLLGNLLALVTGLGMGGNFVAASKSGENEKWSGIFIGNILCAFFGVPFILVFSVTVTFPSIIGIVLLGVFQIGVAYIFYGIAIKHSSPLLCSLLSAVEPLLNPIWVFLFIGEIPGLLAIIGACIVIVTITVWCVFSDKRKSTRYIEDAC